MASYTATVDWALQPGEDFPAGRYSRRHTVSFDAGIAIPASASPHVVPAPWSAADAIDPEEMFVAAISNCHMLSFLHIASKAGFTVLGYRDEAEGVMRKTAEGRIAVTRVALRPVIAFDGRQPTPDELDRLHHEAHEVCYIANSVKTEIVVEKP
ncbi:MAG: OsmC family peroxiredoxin [Caulobacteraceae bacterium]|nr:MAG: OsmC family peroxiredoxin [Caulobacteraceae bacterium]